MRRFSPLFLIAEIAAICLVLGGGACPGADFSDAGSREEPMDGGSTPADAGDGDGDGDGDTDAGPPPGDEEQAERLCQITLQGLANLKAQSIAPDRCSAIDTISDSALDPSLAIDTSLDCLPGKPVYEMFYTGITQQRVRFHIDAIEACLTAARLVRQSRSSWADNSTREAELMALLTGPDCSLAVVPQQNEDDPCEQRWDCPEGTGCEASPLDGLTLSCLAPVSQGQPCGGAINGVPLRSCDDDSVCFNGLCVFPQGQGQMCGPTTVPCAATLVCGPTSTCTLPAGVTELCFDDSQCAAPAFCRNSQCALALEDNESCTPGIDRCAAACSVCRPSSPGGPTACLDRGAAGTPCTADDHCRQGFFCSDDSCMASGVVGTACGPQTPCLAGLTCSGPIPELNTLADGGTADAGPMEPDPISPDGGTDAGVVTDLYCQIPPPPGSACAQGDIPCVFGACVDGVCQTGAVGEPCQVDTHCADGNLCVGDTCVLAPREAAPCTEDLRCAGDLYCEENRCRDFPVAGEACGPGEQCQDSAFCNEELLCEARLPPGQPCLNDEQCASDTCLITLTCAAQTPDPDSDADLFLMMVLFGLLMPWSLRRLSRFIS